MSTASLRRDHDLIEKVIKSMEITIQLLENGKQIPESILNPVIDFSKNFTDVCHHSKEENALFPALEQAGMPRNMGPIAIMLMDHERSRELGKFMESSAKEYINSGSSKNLIDYIRITSYNVCYTKLLRKNPTATSPAPSLPLYKPSSEANFMF